MSNNKKNTPSLDLSFAYGTTIIKQLSEHDIHMFQEAEAAANETGGSDDPTIRTVTSLFTGKRGIKGLRQDENKLLPDGDADAGSDADAGPDSELDDET